MAEPWGRKETIVWQPHMPIYSYAALAGAVLCAVLFLWESYAFQQEPLRKAYLTEYVRATVGAQANQHGMYRLIMLAGPSAAARLALPADFVPGTTPVPGGGSLPIALSPEAQAHGYDIFFRAPEKSYGDKSLHRWLRDAIFGGEGLTQAYVLPLAESLFVLVLALCFAVPRDLRRLREMKYGRLLKGPERLTAKEFNKRVRGDGIGIQTADGTVLRIPRANEAQHFEIIGDTGSGKTTLIMRMLQQIQQRGESAIVYDPACEFVQRFYDPSRGDVILNPLDRRCPYWGPAEELRRKAEAKAIAASLYQPTSDKKGEFFTETPQKIFAHLLTFGPTPQQLVEWMSNPKEIDQRVKGTELASIIEPGAQQQRAGVLASLGLIADSLRMLPTKEQAGGKTWSATQWAEKREGWIFITSQATEREALRPLHSLWIDLLVLRLLSAPTSEQRPVWFVLDELASLQRLPQLHTAITENRKSKNPLILGFQGKAQLETIYGHLAEVMLSQPATKIFLKTTEPKAAEWVSKALGQIEIERMRETHQHGTREGKSFTIDRQTEPLVMDSQIAGLPDKHAYLKLGNYVAELSFTYCHIPPIAPAFQPRAVEDDELNFDPLTLRPRSSDPVENDDASELPEEAVFSADPEEPEIEAASESIPIPAVPDETLQATTPAEPSPASTKLSKPRRKTRPKATAEHTPEETPAEVPAALLDTTPAASSSAEI